MYHVVRDIPRTYLSYTRKFGPLVACIELPLPHSPPLVPTNWIDQGSRCSTRAIRAVNQTDAQMLERTHRSLLHSSLNLSLLTLKKKKIRALRNYEVDTFILH